MVEIGRVLVVVMMLYLAFEDMPVFSADNANSGFGSAGVGGCGQMDGKPGFVMVVYGVSCGCWRGVVGHDE